MVPAPELLCADSGIRVQIRTRHSVSLVPSTFINSAGRFGLRHRSRRPTKCVPTDNVFIIISFERVVAEAGITCLYRGYRNRKEKDDGIVRKYFRTGLFPCALSNLRQ